MLSLVVLSGCLHSDTPPGVEEIARDDYTRIVRNSNVVLFGDVMGYRAGATKAERAPTVCQRGSCSIGFGRPFTSKNFSATDAGLEIPGSRGGVRQVLEHSSSKEYDVRVFGGWMEHSFFASQANLFKDETNPNYGTTAFYSYAVGNSTGQDPTITEGRATWRGFVIGRDSSGSADLESVVQGNAMISVELGHPGMLADVMFTNLANAHTGTTYNDLTWLGMLVKDGGFGRSEGDVNTIEGRFFGPSTEEVGGIFERTGISGAFGGHQ